MCARASAVALMTMLALACSSGPERPAANTASESPAAAQPAGSQGQGWEVRVDQSQSASDPDNTADVDFTGMGAGGFHYAGGPAGTLWMPNQTASGTYTVSSTFTLNKPSSHTNYYGLVFAGSNIGEANQHYLYFQVAQDGTYLIKVRDGNDTMELEGGATKNAAIKTPEGDGPTANTLEVRVTADAINYVVNGTVVHTSPRTGMFAMADGIVGARVNHVTDVTLTNFQVQQSGTN